MGITLSRALEATKDIAELERQTEVLRVQRAAYMAAITGGELEDETDRLPAGRLGVVLGISRQNVQKAIREMGPGTPRARAVARARREGVAS